MPIDTTAYIVTAETGKAKDAAKIGIGAAIGAGVGGAAGTGTVLATHGYPAVVPSETTIIFELTSPLKATIRQ